MNDEPKRSNQIGLAALVVLLVVGCAMLAWELRAIYPGLIGNIAAVISVAVVAHLIRYLLRANRDRRRQS
jgi:predicted tellurium resistance membrane protein TerC